MSLPPDKLHRYFDRDLSEDESTAVAREVAGTDDEARLAALGRIGELVRLEADAAADFDADALFGRIQSGLAAQPNPRLRVIQGQRKNRTFVAVGAVVALAAAVTLFFVTRPPSVDETAAHPFDTRREVLVDNTEAPVLVHPPGGSEVENVEWGASTGTVFHVEGSEGQPLAVVWIDEGSF